MSRFSVDHRDGVKIGHIKDKVKGLLGPVDTPREKGAGRATRPPLAPPRGVWAESGMRVRGFEPAPMPAPANRELSPPHSSPGVVVAGLLAVGALPWLVAADAAEAAPYAVQAILLFSGLVAILSGLAGGVRDIRFPPAWGECSTVAAITAGALALRALGLDSTLRILVDEGNSIRHLQVTPGAGVGLVDAPSVYVTTMLYPYGHGVVASLVGPTLTGLRAFSALIGAATIPASYVLARALLGRSAAVVAAVTLATFPPHLHFSRLALPHVMDVFFGTVSIAAISCALAGNRRFAWALGGVALGLTHYGFEAGRWFFTPLIATWLATLALTTPGRLRKQRRGIGLLAMACGATIFPVYASAALRDAALAPRLQQGSASIDLAETSEIFRRVAAAFSVYAWRPDSSFFYGGDSALVLLPLLPVVVLGLTAIAMRPQSLAIVVPLWIVGAALGNALMADVSSYARWVVAHPAIALAAAAGAVSLRGALPRRWATPVLVLVSAAIALGQALYYFGPHVTRFQAQWHAHKADRDTFGAVLYAADRLADGTELIFASEPPIDVHPPRELLSFVAAGRAMTVTAVRLADLPELLGELRSDRRYAFFVAPQEAATKRLRDTLAVTGPILIEPRPLTGEDLEVYVAGAGTVPESSQRSGDRESD